MNFVRIGALRQDAGMVVRLLAVGMPLTIALGTIVAAVAWPALDGFVLPIAVVILLLLF